MGVYQRAAFLTFSALIGFSALAIPADPAVLGAEKLEAPLSWVESGMGLEPFSMRSFLKPEFLSGFDAITKTQEMFLPGECKPFKTKLAVEKTVNSVVWNISIDQCGEDLDAKSFLTVERRRFEDHEKLTYKFFKEGLVALGYMGSIGDFLLTPEIEFRIAGGSVESISAKNLAYPAAGSNVPLESLRATPQPEEEDSLDKFALVFDRLDFSLRDGSTGPSGNVQGQMQIKEIANFAAPGNTFLVSTPFQGSTVLLAPKLVTPAPEAQLVEEVVDQDSPEQGVGSDPLPTAG